MTVLMTFDRLPVFAGTYFPPRDGVRGTRRGFSSILREYRSIYLRDPQELVSNGQDIAQRVVQRAQPARSATVPNEQALLTAVGGLSDGFDPVHGGFGRAPKFPRSSNLELLSRHYRRSGDRRSLEMIETTLDKMAAGGMYDQIGGGFHRYSTDARWLVPHFEKMLYDNAQLVVAYLEAFQITGKGNYARVTREILDYVMREMTHPLGGFYSATDADSPAPSGHDEEGLFFTWTPHELKAVLGAGDAALLVQKFYGVTARGNFEGRSILNVTEPLNVIARALNMALPEAERHLVEAKTKLYEKRLERKPPILDDKVLTSWNGLMISAFAKASFALSEPDYVEAAKRAASFLMSSVWDGKNLKRTWRNGETKYAAYLDDYAFLAAGLLDLYEATGESIWLEKAQNLQTTLDAHFWDPSAGGYFFVADDHETLLAREKPDYDGAIPAGNSVAALNLQRLALLTGDDAFRVRSEQLMMGFGGALRRYGRGLPKLLTALDFHLDEPLQVVIVRPPGGGEADELLRPLRETFVPNRVLVRVAESEIEQLAQRMPPIAGKKCKDGKPTAYVCRGPICTRPMVSPSKLKGELAKVIAYGTP